MYSEGAEKRPTAKGNMMSWNVFMTVDFLDNVGGVSASVVTQALLLRRIGHVVTLYVEEWPSPSNQYFAELRRHRIRVVYAPKVFGVIAQKSDLRNVLFWLVSPVVVVLAIVHMAFRGKCFRESWRSVDGWLNWYLPHKTIMPLHRWALLFLLTMDLMRRSPTFICVARGTLGLRWAAFWNRPSVYVEASVPSLDLGLDWWDDLKRHIGKASLVVTVCEAGAEGVRSVCRYHGPVVVLPWIVEDPYSEADVPLGAQGINADRISIIVGTAGRLNHEKGQEWLLRAIPLVLSMSERPVEFWIAGDGPDRPALESLARELSLYSPALRFLGSQDRNGMEKFWQEIDILVMPSLIEAVPLAVIEAMAHRVPTIATGVGGVKEMLGDGSCGYVVPPRDSSALAHSILHLISSPVEMQGMGHAAREKYLRTYAPEASFPLWLDAFSQVARSVHDRSME